MKVIIAGGGTGGHLFPAVAVGRRDARRSPASEVLFVGTTAGLEARWMPRSGLRYELLRVHGWTGKDPLERLRAVGEFVAALRRARTVLRYSAPTWWWARAVTRRRRWRWRRLSCVRRWF